MEPVEDELAAALAAHFGLRLADGAPGVVGPAGDAEQ